MFFSAIIFHVCCVSFRYGRVDFFISVFSVSGTYELKDFFMKLGVAKVFSNQADLSGITQDANLKMSRVSL